MVARRLAQYIVAERDASLPPQAWRGVRRCFVDWVATTVPGGVQAPATVLSAALHDEITGGGAELVPGAATTSARTAALINSAASHTVEFDDIYRDGIYHPGSPVIAAALATAQAQGSSGETLQRAIISGYEVSNRIAALVNPEHYRYWHTTATVGAFGAAAAAASVLGLNRDATAQALSSVATLAAGLQQSFLSESMSKPLHVGNAAANGVLVAQAAQHGLTGADAMLEGDYGFGAAMCDSPDWSGVFDGLGEDYTIDRVTQKNHGCCGHTFAAIDATLALREQHELAHIDVEDIQKIVVHTYAAAIKITANDRPTTAMEGRFSMPFVIATAILFGAVRLSAFSPQRLSSANTLALAQKVELQVEPTLESSFPRQRAATVEIFMNDGRKLRHHCPTRKGDPDNPLSDEEIDAKLRELVSGHFDDIDSVSKQLWQVGERDSVAGLFGQLTDAKSKTRSSAQLAAG